MKNGKWSSHLGWGIFLILLGVFFLIGNFFPQADIIRYWPIFLIAAGVYKALGCCCQDGKE